MQLPLCASLRIAKQRARIRISHSFAMCVILLKVTHNSIFAEVKDPLAKDEIATLEKRLCTHSKSAWYSPFRWKVISFHISYFAIVLSCFFLPSSATFSSHCFVALDKFYSFTHCDTCASCITADIWANVFWMVLLSIEKWKVLFLYLCISTLVWSFLWVFLRIFHV